MFVEKTKINKKRPGLAHYLKNTIAEIVELPIILAGIIGMYQGIEISHPVYAVLFLDLVVCFLIAGTTIFKVDLSWPFLFESFCK